MTRYGLHWFKTRFWWRFHRVMGWLMSPCWPMTVAWKTDVLVFRQKHGPLCRFYDTWTLRLRIISYGKWSDLCYGKKFGAMEG